MRLIRYEQVKWWSDELSKNQYDGIIGLSQGAAMGALLISMVSTVRSFITACGYVVDGNHDASLVYSSINPKGSLASTPRRLSQSNLPYFVRVHLPPQDMV
jgi:hypothetical protein